MLIPMKQIALLSLVMIFSLVVSGCLKKPTTPTETTGTGSVQQSGITNTNTAEVEVLATGDFSDPEVEEIIGMLEELVAEDEETSTGSVVVSGAVAASGAVGTGD